MRRTWPEESSSSSLTGSEAEELDDRCSRRSDPPQADLRPNIPAMLEALHKVIAPLPDDRVEAVIAVAPDCARIVCFWVDGRRTSCESLPQAVPRMHLHDRCLR